MRSRSPGRSYSRLSKSPGQQSSGGATDQRIQKLEAMVSKITCAQHGLGRFGEENQFQSSFGTLEHRQQQIVYSDDLNNLVIEMDKQMKEVEDRVVNHLTTQIEDQGIVFNHKIDGLGQRLQAVETEAHRTSTSERRHKILESSQITQGGKLNPAKMEAALNDWL